jgi:drug/metabolite transporter (DMT)-like permease
MDVVMSERDMSFFLCRQSGEARISPFFPSPNSLMLKPLARKRVRRVFPTFVKGQWLCQLEVDRRSFGLLRLPGEGDPLNLQTSPLKRIIKCAPGLVGYRVYALGVVLCVIWGMAFVAIRVADSQPDLSPVNLTILRWVTVSAAFLVLYPFIMKPKVRFERKDFPRLFVVALTSVDIYHLSLNYSEKIVDASVAGVLISLGPLFAIIFSAVLLHERTGRKFAFGLVLALMGAILISSPDLSLGSGTIFGPLGVIVSSLASGVYIVTSKPLVGKYGAFSVAVWSAFVGTLVLLPLTSQSLFKQAAELPAQGWAAIIYLAILSTVIANLIFFTLLERQSVSRLSIQLYLIPLVSVIGGAALLGESITLTVIAGGVVLLLGVTIGTRSHH